MANGKIHQKKDQTDMYSPGTTSYATGLPTDSGTSSAFRWLRPASMTAPKLFAILLAPFAKGKGLR